MTNKHNDNDRRDWINNHEPLYRTWIASKKPIRKFIQENREWIDTVINQELNRKPLS